MGSVPSMVRSTRGRAELSVQVVPGQHNRASLFLVDLPTARDLVLRAKHLFVAANGMPELRSDLGHEGGLRCRRPHRR